MAFRISSWILIALLWLTVSSSLAAFQEEQGQGDLDAALREQTEQGQPAAGEDELDAALGVQPQPADNADGPEDDNTFGQHQTVVPELGLEEQKETVLYKYHEGAVADLETQVAKLEQTLADDLKAAGRLKSKLRDVVNRIENQQALVGDALVFANNNQGTRGVFAILKDQIDGVTGSPSVTLRRQSVAQLGILVQQFRALEAEHIAGQKEVDRIKKAFTKNLANRITRLQKQIERAFGDLEQDQVQFPEVKTSLSQLAFRLKYLKRPLDLVTQRLEKAKEDKGETFYERLSTGYQESSIGSEFTTYPIEYLTAKLYDTEVRPVALSTLLSLGVVDVSLLQQLGVANFEGWIAEHYFEGVLNEAQSTRAVSRTPELKQLVLGFPNAFVRQSALEALVKIGETLHQSGSDDARLALKQDFADIFSSVTVGPGVEAEQIALIRRVALQKMVSLEKTEPE